jgi:hypothetical protein
VKAFCLSDGTQEDRISVADSENLMPFKTDTECQGIYYIDPSESSYRSLHFAVNQKYKALSVLVFGTYNKSATERVFYIDLTQKEGSSKATGA